MANNENEPALIYGVDEQYFLTTEQANQAQFESIGRRRNEPFSNAPATYWTKETRRLITELIYQKVELKPKDTNKKNKNTDTT